MKLMLILGSGVSYASGLPNVHQITDSILNDAWHSDTDENFYPGPETNPAFQRYNWINKIQTFLRLLKKVADGYYALRPRGQANYEDLYYMTEQIKDDKRYEIDNPMIEMSVKEIKEQTRDLCTPFDNHPDTEEVTLEKISNRSCDFIQCAVWCKLSTTNQPQGLELILELAQSEKIEKLDIFSLNHDILIETLFSTNYINYIDGFKESEEELRIFDPSLYERENKIRLFKLHGSINWFYWRINDKLGEIDTYGICTSRELGLCKDAQGNYIKSIGAKPIFLAGTYNKIFAYSSGIFSDIYYWFHKLLKEHNIIIMSGYGWNDKGINARLMNWIGRSFDKHLYLLHENPEEDIRDKSKSAMGYRYNKLVEDGRLIPIKKWLSNMGMEELFEEIRKTIDVSQ